MLKLFVRCQKTDTGAKTRYAICRGVGLEPGLSGRIGLDFSRNGSIHIPMNAQAVPGDLDAMFEALLDALGEALELAVLPDRDNHLVEIADYCATAARLTSEALARR